MIQGGSVTNRAYFQSIVSVYVLLLIGYLVMVFVGADDLPLHAKVYMEWWRTQPQSRAAEIGDVLVLGAFGANLFSAVSLALFRQIGRRIFVLSLVPLIFSEALQVAPVLETTIQQSMDSCAGILAGYIVAVAYHSPLAEEFRSRKQGTSE